MLCAQMCECMCIHTAQISLIFHADWSHKLGNCLDFISLTKYHFLKEIKKKKVKFHPEGWDFFFLVLFDGEGKVTQNLLISSMGKSLPKYMKAGNNLTCTTHAKVRSITVEKMKALRQVLPKSWASATAAVPFQMFQVRICPFFLLVTNGHRWD